MSLKLILACLCIGMAVKGFAGGTFVVKPADGDMTPIIRDILDKSNDKDIHLTFESGTYKFLPDYATGKYLEITNHGNGYKKIIFNFGKFRSVIVEGNNAQFVFHGQCMPFLFDGCKSVVVKNLTIDWDIPFNFLGEVMAVNEKEGWRDIKPRKEGFSWVIKNGKLEFPNIDGFSYVKLGSTLAFDAVEKRPAHGAWDMESDPKLVEQLPNGNLRFHEKLKNYPPIGSLLDSKGDREHDRYAPAFDFRNSSDIEINGVVIHHALGMGFLFERSQQIKVLNSGIYLRSGSNRVVSTTADATHFCNCKGSILVENCRFENMLDDGTNVHGTYVEVDEVTGERSVRVKFKHFEQLGFQFAAPLDEVWFITQPSPERGQIGVIKSVKKINEEYLELTFTKAMPNGLKKGNVLENKTWNPEFTMRGCTIRNHRARNVVLKTPLKTVIENNEFSSMMSSVFLRGESFFWYESGAVTDVLIRNNKFNYCAYGGGEHAVLNIWPRLGRSFDQTALFDRNIRFEGNSIRTFDNRIVIADRVDGLTINGNTITQTNEALQLYPKAPVFEFKNCSNVTVGDNSYSGNAETAVKADEKSTKTLVKKGNKGF
ncbi:MAG: right-handed parallel beta-helix repeat-containing protein [Bacteroidetes bacterium]|nr:MAG: right-handed parallel beta-helix repeat-containing protein [Bacteroidota bacterium]